MHSRDHITEDADSLWYGLSRLHDARRLAAQHRADATGTFFRTVLLGPLGRTVGAFVFRLAELISAPQSVILSGGTTLQQWMATWAERNAATDQFPRPVLVDWLQFRDDVVLVAV